MSGQLAKQAMIIRQCTISEYEIESGPLALPHTPRHVRGFDAVVLKNRGVQRVKLSSGQKLKNSGMRIPNFDETKVFFTYLHLDRLSVVSLVYSVN